ncbi:MAG: endonuclease/exonuclease/phosphatase family protein [Chitinispirillia bacterium]|nr:endonuclease/exonuclease/phosphatase family protein [Chitinispirillia bacterium]
MLINTFGYSTISEEQHLSPISGTVCNSAAVRVMSFNIRYGSALDGKNSWRYRRGQVSSILREQDADIIGLQEALRFQLSEINSSMDDYTEIGFGRDDGDTLGEYSPILYKKSRFTALKSGTLWFSDTPLTPGSKHWGNKYPRIFTFAKLTDKITGRKILVYNVHLDHANSYSRWRSISLLHDHIKKHKCAETSLILLGDFNSGENSAVIKYMTGRANFRNSKDPASRNPLPLKDTFRYINPRGFGGTFHMFWGKSFGPRLDYIFVSNDAKIKDASIIRSNVNGRYPSDHFPITAEILFSSPKNLF